MLIILLQFNLSNSVRFRERFEEWFHRGSLVMALLAASFRNAGCREHPTFHSILPPTPSPSQGLPLGTWSHRWSCSVGTLGGRVFIGPSTALTHAHLERVLNVSFISRSSLGSESLLPYGRVFFFLCFSKPKQIQGGKKYFTEDLSVQCVWTCQI